MVDSDLPSPKNSSFDAAQQVGWLNVDWEFYAIFTFWASKCRGKVVKRNVGGVTPRWHPKFKTQKQLHKNTDQNSISLKNGFKCWVLDLANCLLRWPWLSHKILQIFLSFPLPFLGHPTGGPGLRELVDRKIPNQWAYGYGWYAISWQNPKMTTWFFQKQQLLAPERQLCQKICQEKRFVKRNEETLRQQSLGPCWYQTPGLRVFCQALDFVVWSHQSIVSSVFVCSQKAPFPHFSILFSSCHFPCDAFLKL